MSKQKRDALEAAMAGEVAKMRAAIQKRDWRAAGKVCDQLRCGYGWNYARIAQEFGGTERWEEIAQAIDHAETERDDSDELDD